MTSSSDIWPGWFKPKRSLAEENASESAAGSTTGGGSETEPVKVWEAANLMEAHVIKGRLESEGIPAILRGEALGAIYGLTTGGLAMTTVWVPAPLVERALSLLYEEVGSDMDEEMSEETGSDGDE